MKCASPRHTVVLHSVLILCALAILTAAQSSADVSYSDANGYSAFRLLNGTFTSKSTSRITGAGSPAPVYDYATTVNVSSLQLDGATVEEDGGRFSFRVYCKGHREVEEVNGADYCVAVTTSYAANDARLSYANKSSREDYVQVTCNSRSDCERFLNALKGGPRADVGSDVGPTQGQQTQDQSANTFHDVLDRIAWRSGSGTKTLDDLVNKTKPAPKPARPPSEQPTYAAFAQSAGFDANSGHGSAVGDNLNQTIGQANVNCVANAKTACGDEGYCMLRPGLWGAWASDLKYLGAKAFSCNLKTREDAESQALAWCGTGCSIVWSGAGK